MNSAASECDVICVGIIVADHVCAPIRKFPAPGGLITTPSLELTIGGCAANVSTDLAKLGVKVSLVGCVGNDPFGQYVRSALAENDVCCEHIRISEKSQTSATMVVNVQNEDRRFIHAVGANTELTGREVSDELLQKSKIVYVGGFGLNPELSGENVREMFARARELQVTTVLDVVLDRVDDCIEMLKVALPETDIFLPNQDEAHLLTGESDPVKQAEIFLNQGAGTVVITSGPDGSILRDQTSSVIHLPAYQVEQVDGTGGGDAFVAGFLYGVLQGSKPQQSLMYGSAMGASCVQHAGATTGVFRVEELEAFVKENQLTPTVEQI
ncbi:carbohydrate kinase family protein [Thalassoglobus sp.]|uniref:carbohydrate kinase family protein n=1 Tax=Thalassoglobus sp. TaxID=2795869 RepID=UPI003AA83A7F